MGTKKRTPDKQRSDHPERPHPSGRKRGGPARDTGDHPEPRKEEELIDESLEETFPASDPPSPGRFD